MSKDRLNNEYTGVVAENYESKRIAEVKWHREQATLRDILHAIPLPSAPTVLDVPVGTGRFMSDYASCGACVIGIDISDDMLVQAAQRARDLGFNGVKFERGDATKINLVENSVDLAVCVRLLNWLTFDVMCQTVIELSRVSEKYVVLGVRSTLPLSNESARSLFLRGLYAVKRAVRRSVRPGRLFIVRHSERQILNAIDSAGLEITKRQLIERRPDGTRYEFFVLSAPS